MLVGWLFFFVQTRVGDKTKWLGSARACDGDGITMGGDCDKLGLSCFVKGVSHFKDYIIFA